MEIFEHPNISGDWICPICKMNTDKPCILIGIDDAESGNNIQAEQVHVHCIELRINKEHHLIYQVYE